MQPGERGAQRRVNDGRLIDCGAGQPAREKGLIEVEFAFAKPANAWCGASVVGHAWRKEDHSLPCRVALAAVKAVVDGTVFDDEHGPRVVAVPRVSVIHQVRMEHLADTRDPRRPGLDMATRGKRLGVHVKIVQDRD